MTTTYEYRPCEPEGPWGPGIEAREGLPTVTGVGRDDWVRLIPVDALERSVASLPTRALVVDRKRAPAHDLTFARPSDELIASERLVRSLERAGANGFRASLVPHATPNGVHGHVHYRLTADGFTGPVVETKVVPLRFEQDPPSDPRLHFDRQPIGPVTFDGRDGSGHDLCFSPWMGGVTGRWRALIVRGDVYARLLEDLDAPVFGAERVIVREPPPRSDEAPVAVRGVAEPPADARSVRDLIAVLRAQASRYGHELPPGADEATIAKIEGLAGFPLPPAYAELLAATDGAALFGRELLFLSARPATLSIERGVAWATEAEEGTYAGRRGWLAVASTTDQEIVWAIDAEGFVRGLGQEGIIYGPDAPFEAWLTDQIADLAWAAEQPPRRRERRVT